MRVSLLGFQEQEQERALERALLERRICSILLLSRRSCSMMEELSNESWMMSSSPAMKSCSVSERSRSSSVMLFLRKVAIAWRPLAVTRLCRMSTNRRPSFRPRPSGVGII